MAGKRGNRDCENLLTLFDEVEKTSQQILELVHRGLKIRNDEEAIKRILREIKDKL